MPDLTTQKRLAAEILGVGISRVRIDPTKISEVESALRREDIKKLVDEGVIWAEPTRRNSRGRWKELHEKRKRGHRRGYGSREGSKVSRSDPELMWVYTIRKIRRYLKWLRDNEVVDRKTYRKIYLHAKGGAFKSLADLKRYLSDLGIKVR